MTSGNELELTVPPCRVVCKPSSVHDHDVPREKRMIADLDLRIGDQPDTGQQRQLADPNHRVLTGVEHATLEHGRGRPDVDGDRPRAAMENEAVTGLNVRVLADHYVLGNCSAVPVPRENLLRHQTVPMIRAGLPCTRTRLGTSVVTTAPASITDPAPTWSHRSFPLLDSRCRSESGYSPAVPGEQCNLSA